METVLFGLNIKPSKMENKKQIYLHIGYNKTGTSAVQNSFYRNRKSLKKNGVYYPVKCRGKRRSPAHHSLAESLLYHIGKPLPRFVNAKIYREYPMDYYWNLLKHELADTDCQAIFISSEAFNRLRANPGQIEFIREHLHDFDVKILVYLRSLPEFLESAYNQAVKRGRESRSVDELMEMGWMNINYFEEIEQWAAVFGTNNMIVRIFDKETMKGGVVKDIIKVLKQEGLNVDTSGWSAKFFDLRWNIRLPNNMVERKRRINASVKLPGFLDKAVNLYLHWVGSYAPDVSLLSHEQKEQIRNKNFISNQKLGEKYLNLSSPFSETD